MRQEPLALSSEALQLLRMSVRINCHCSVLNSKLDGIRSLFVMRGQADIAVPGAIALLPLEQLKHSCETSVWQHALEEQEAKLCQVQQQLSSLLQ